MHDISSKLHDLKTHLQPGQVYRREALAQWSKAVDRHIKQLVSDGVLTKMSGGLYCCSKKTAFGNSPAEDKTLVEAFLKDGHFLLTSPNAYNALGVGTTQLYSETVVYNHKRHGRFVLGGRVFDFRVKPRFPNTPTKEFLFVDLVNNLDQLAEERQGLLERVKAQVDSFDRDVLLGAVREYGGAHTQKFFAKIFANDITRHAV